MFRNYFFAAGLFVLIAGHAATQDIKVQPDSIAAGAGEEGAPPAAKQWWPVQITKAEGAFGVGWQYDRTFMHDSEMFAKGLAALNDVYTFNAGFSFNSTIYYKEWTSFISGDVSLALVPVRFFHYFNIELLYIYFNNPDYDWRVNSLIPLLSFNSKWLSASFGTHLRWTSFFDEAPIQEGMWAMDLVLTPLRTKPLDAGAAIANFDEFFQGGFWDFYLRVFLNYRLKEQITLDNSVTLLQTGIDGFTVSLYGIKIRSAVRVTW
jgi:hypothetical protein